MQWSINFVWNFWYLHIHCMGHLIFFATALCVTVCTRYFSHRNCTPKDIWTRLKICIKLSRIVLFLDDQHAILSLKTLQSKKCSSFPTKKTDNSHEISCLKNLDTPRKSGRYHKFVVCCSQGLTICLPAMNFVICLHDTLIDPDSVPERVCWKSWWSWKITQHAKIHFQAFSYNKSLYQKMFFYSQPKHMLWVFKRTVSIRRFFWAPKTYVKTDR